MAGVEENNAMILGFLAKGVITAKGGGVTVDTGKEDVFGLVEYGEAVEAATEFAILGDGMVGCQGKEVEDVAMGVFGEFVNYAPLVQEKEGFFAGIRDVVGAYRYYLYFGYAGKEYLFLSNDAMAMMVNFYGDGERQVVDIPAPYRPVTAVSGTECQRAGGAWELKKQGEGLAGAFHMKTGMPMWEFAGMLPFVYANYDVVLYHNDPYGNITEAGKIMAWDVK